MFVLRPLLLLSPAGPPQLATAYAAILVLQTEINCCCCLHRTVDNRWTGHAETKKVTSFIGDICEPAEEVIGKAFEGVDCVFHCAAFIDFQFPPNLRELERVNVEGKIYSIHRIVLPTPVFFHSHPHNTTHHRLHTHQSPSQGSFLYSLHPSPSSCHTIPLVRLITVIIIRAIVIIISRSQPGAKKE